MNRITATQAKRLEQDLHALLVRANLQGFVITVELQPTQPLRMGGYTMKADVRPAHLGNK